VAGVPPETLRHLRCPICGQPLAPAPTAATTALRCPAGHSFDVARQGYVNLTAGRAPHSGDTPAMVAAREAFLGAGHYDFISAALAARAVAAAGGTTGTGAAAQRQAPGPGGSTTYPDLVVDAGAGTGRHLAAVLDALPTATGLALDASKPALRRAARAHPRAGAALCDTWRRLPLADGAAGLLLNVFAPRNGAEFRRVLRPDGTLLVVTPAADHLHELVDLLGLLRVDPAKEERVAGSLTPHFTPGDVTERRHTLRLTRAEVRTLVEMGPSAWHTDADRLDGRIGTLVEPVPVTAAVRIAAYHPR